MVEAGLLRVSTWRPADGLWHKSKGQVVVPFPAEVIKAAPKPGKNHISTKEQVAQLAEHYTFPTSEVLSPAGHHRSSC